MTSAETISRLKAARDGFWFSLGAYALLTKEPAKSELGRYDIRVFENGDIVVSDGHVNEYRGTNYSVGFKGGLSDSAAKGVVNNSFKQMIIDSKDAIFAYAHFNNIDVSKSSAIQLIRHYRNAIAHNGCWHLSSSHSLPLTWRNRTLTIDMNNQPIEGFLTWFDGLQLCAQLNIFVTEHAK